MIFKPSEICDFELDFNKKCLEIYDWQLNNNQLYGLYCKQLVLMGISHPKSVVEVCEIPLMPIEVFRDSRVIPINAEPDVIFKSSGTTGMIRSEHPVPFLDIYKKAIWKGLEFFYPINEYVFLGYTPGYNQNPNSSLIWMINYMISRDTSGLSQFLPIGEPIPESLMSSISALGKKIMIFGAAFGLLELVVNHPHRLPETSIIMETGGMKTFRREMTRDDLHTQLAHGFGLPKSNIHSEYGMTELLSQAYSKGTEWFETPPWMKVTIRNPENPEEILPIGVQGQIGVIDLANWATQPFLLTGDRGVMREDGSFKVLGRWNSYFLRGCNFLLEND
jgi:hypothetical protein